LPKDADSTDELIIPEHRNQECSSKAAEFNRRNNKWMALAIGLLLLEVGNVDNLLRDNHPLERAAWRRWPQITLTRLNICCWRTVSGCGPHGVAVAKV
jgi:hypothetical protein